jgi:small subunit ribosomal protein S2
MRCDVGDKIEKHNVMTHHSKLNKSGSRLPLFIPQTSPSPDKSPRHLSLSTLLASGAALGHASTRMSPSFTPFVYGTRSELSIIDLDQTLPIIRRTMTLIRDVVKADGVVLIVGTRPGLRKGMEKAKERLDDNGFITSVWLPGTLTNSATL